jgi:hypothetical protein
LSTAHPPAVNSAGRVVPKAVHRPVGGAVDGSGPACHRARRHETPGEQRLSLCKGKAEREPAVTGGLVSHHQGNAPPSLLCVAPRATMDMAIGPADPRKKISVGPSFANGAARVKIAAKPRPRRSPASLTPAGVRCSRCDRRPATWPRRSRRGQRPVVLEGDVDGAVGGDCRAGPRRGQAEASDVYARQASSSRTGRANPSSRSSPNATKLTPSGEADSTTLSLTSTCPAPAWAASRAARLTVRPK